MKQIVAIVWMPTVLCAGGVCLVYMDSPWLAGFLFTCMFLCTPFEWKWKKQQ